MSATPPEFPEETFTREQHLAIGASESTDPLGHLTPDQREGLTEIVRLLWPGYMACLAEHQSS
jgi:hypothetical protein